MTRHIALYLTALLLATACGSDAKIDSMTGYITLDTLSSTIAVREPDSTAVVVFAITEHTQLCGGALLEGNLAEVVYSDSQEKGVLPQAISITADKTFPQALGRWATRRSDTLHIDIELLPDGRIQQHAPADILTYTRWRLTAEEDIIELCGTLWLPSPSDKKQQKTEKKEAAHPTKRLPYNFRVKAQTDIDGDRRVLTILTSKNRKARLYKEE